MAKKKPLRKVQEENGDLLDRTMHTILSEGVTALDEEGKVVKLTPSAAMLNAIGKRLKDLGVNAMPKAGTPSGDLIGEAARRGLRINGRPVAMPPISEEDDAATGTD